MTFPLKTAAVGACAAAGLVTFAAGSVQSATFTLRDEQVAEAVEHGKMHFDQDVTAFRWPYINNQGYGCPYVLMRTEYLAVSDYVRRSEYQREYGSQRVHKLNKARIKSAQSEVDGHLQFLVTVYGPSEDSMGEYDFTLMAGDKKVMPAYVDRPVMAENSGFKGKPMYAAPIITDFPTDDLNGDEQVTLVVDPPDGLDPAGSCNANFNVLFGLASVKQGGALRQNHFRWSGVMPLSQQERGLGCGK